MVRRRLLLPMVVLLLLATVRTSGQAGWTAWLFDQTGGLMTRVNETGVIDSFTLPLPPGFDQYPHQVAVGHGGAPFAYVVYNSITYQGQIVVSQRDQILATFSLPLTISDNLEIVAGEQPFNDDNSAIALGYSLDGGGWAIIVLAVNGGGVTHTIRHDTPTVEILGLPAGVGLTPVIRRFRGQMVTFNLVQSGTEAASQYDAYTWNLDDNTIMSDIVFVSLDADMLPATGEVVLSLPDERLPNQDQAFMFFQANSLHVFDPAASGRFPFYNAANQSLFWPRFIQNGLYVLFGASDPNGSTLWTVAARNGTALGSLPPNTVINDVAGVDDGFIYTTDAFTPGATTLVHVVTTDGLDAGVPVWTSAPGAAPLIAWAGGGTVSAQGAFPAWAQLADPVYLPGSQPLAEQFAPTMTPIGLAPGQVPQTTPIITGMLAVGRLATIHTTEGDQLNVRLGPGTEYDVVAQLGNGARVTLIEGPRLAGGFTWWKVRTASGIEGWAVESVDDNGTRLQTLLPG